MFLRSWKSCLEECNLSFPVGAGLGRTRPSNGYFVHETAKRPILGLLMSDKYLTCSLVKHMKKYHIMACWGHVEGHGPLPSKFNYGYNGILAKQKLDNELNT